MFMSSPHRTSRARRLVTAAVTVVAGLALVTGCSRSSSVNLSGEKLVPSSKAHDMLVAAKQTVAGAETVHVKGLIVAGGTPITVDLGLATAAATGTAEIDGSIADIRMINGALYVDADAGFWDGMLQGVGAGFGGSWVKLSTRFGPQATALLELVPAASALDRLAPSTSSWTEVPGRTVGGVETVGVKETQSGHGNTVYIAKAKPGRPVAVELLEGGLLTFSDWGKPMKNVAMPRGLVLDATDAKLKDSILPTK